MPAGKRIEIVIPAESQLGPWLDAEIVRRQKAEIRLAKTERREPAFVKLQEVILRICSERAGVEFVRPRVGKRSLKRVSE